MWESKSLNICAQIHQGSLTYSWISWQWRAFHPDLACASRGSLFGLDEGIVEYVHKLVPTEWAVTTHRLDGWSWCKQPVQDRGMGWQHVVSESGVYRVYPSSLHFSHRQTDDTPLDLGVFPPSADVLELRYDQLNKAPLKIIKDSDKPMCFLTWGTAKSSNALHWNRKHTWFWDPSILRTPHVASCLQTTVLNIQSRWKRPGPSWVMKSGLKDWIPSSKHTKIWTIHHESKTVSDRDSYGSLWPC